MDIEGEEKGGEESGKWKTVFYSPPQVSMESSWSPQVLVESSWSLRGVLVESSWSPHGVLIESL
jgi:hypothetical protein